MRPDPSDTYSPELTDMTPDDPARTYKMSLTASTHAVRDGLRLLTDALRTMQVNAEDTAAAELVVAETLNNIVEHAYSDRGHGDIDVIIEHQSSHVAFKVLDHGKAMPGGEPPSGEQADLNCATADLPEGGFGWFLIRELTEDLHYMRKDAANVFSFRMPLGQAPSSEL